MNISLVGLNLIIIAILMLLSAFFSGSETAFSALTKVQIFRIRSENKKSSSYIIKFIDNPSQLFITVLFGNVIVNLSFISITSTFIFHDVFRGQNLGLASATAIGVELGVLLLLGEITPKSIALHNAEKFSRFSARPLWLFSQLILPFRKTLKIVTNMLLPLFGIRNTSKEHILSSEELKTMVKNAKEHGAINAKEGDIIANIFDLCDIEANEAMIPRNQISCLEMSRTIKEAFQQSIKSRFSRLPIYRKDLHSICGIFYVKDFSRWRGKLIESKSSKIIDDLTIEEFITNRATFEKMYPGSENTLIRLPIFAYEKKKIGELIHILTNRKRRMAILLDENGDISGLITVKDIIDEVLGDILDEPDSVDGHPVEYHDVDRATYTISGLVSLRSMQSKFNWEIGNVNVETVGGYVFTLSGRIPNVGDIVYDETNQIEFEIIKMDDNRIELLKVNPRRAHV